ncbi:EamA domain-containing membrane protein RarD [Fontibacillus panacisegetis]|uniref:EamA domain-containing membrane protein RarD n=1 Tax=Fontibacillus panacisegetis TaxID=670482 RepID=A0A1G7PWH8_9BACL|nr:DMT family transporter [Fontibacillus panacisegetis]SDF90624.1 EamA domain-containing membrane protein RarD [Fontibacillus panacisegetis]
MNRSRLADLGLLLVAMMWGCTFLIVQQAVRVLPPLAFNGIRFIGAALLLTIIISLFYRSDWRKMSWTLMLHASLLGFFLFLGYAFQTIGLLYTSTSNTGFITGLSVVFVPFISLLLLKHKITWHTWLSALLAAIGLYLLAFAGTSYSMNHGDALILLCAIAFALHVAYTGIFAPKYPTLPLAAMQMAVVGILSLVSSFWFEESLYHQFQNTVESIMKPEVIIALLVSIGPTSALAFWIQTECQKFTSPARVAVIFAMEPVFAALTGVFFGGESLTYYAVIGCVCIFVGMILTELKSSSGKVQ